MLNRNEQFAGRGRPRIGRTAQVFGPDQHDVQTGPIAAKRAIGPAMRG